MSRKNNLTIGHFGEDLAVKYLHGLGFKIIDRNFREKHGELDIVCLDGNILVFVEVKTRRSDKFGLPTEAITPWKLRTLINAAYYYKLLHPQLPDSFRIDLVSLTLTENNKVDTIELFRNITN